MKKIVVLMVAGSLVLVGGCAKKVASRQSPVVSKPKVEEVKKDAFPAELVGTWQGKSENQTGWEITFKRDGTIESFINYWSVRINVAEGGAAEELREGSVAAYSLGPVSSEYHPNSRELNVDIVTDDFYMSLPIGEAEGAAQDVIKGTVSDDWQVWTAKWWNYSEIKGSEGIEPNKVVPQEIVFRKVTGNQK